MPDLIQCSGCKRHVFVDEPDCPFCRRSGARAAILPGVAVVVALSLLGCRSSAVEEEHRRQVEELERVKQRQETARTQAAVYGAPPPRASGSASASPKCNCKPDDPLCSCL